MFKELSHNIYTKLGRLRRPLQILLGILFFALIVELILIAPAEIKDGVTKPKKAASIAPKSEDIEQMMEGIHVIESKSENKQWELWADDAVGIRDKNDLALKKVKAQFFADDGVSFNVTGETGTVSTDSKDITVGGGVTTQSSNGYMFRTTDVQYNSKARYLNSPLAVEVTGPKDKTGHSIYIKGNKMWADLNKGVVLIENEVVAKKALSSNRRLAVSSNKAQLSGREKSVRFSGTVVIDYNGMKITGPDALFKYGGQSDELQSIDLDGGVKVSDFSKWATSEKLSINLAKNEFVFDGKPRVVQDEDELRGDRIVFLDGGKKVKVLNAKVKVSRDSLNQKGVKP